MADNIYLQLTKEFNRGKTRAVITSGQAVVIHGLAIMSKDGDWILRENEDDLNFVLQVLSRYKAKYRFGAPLDLKWMKGGWSSHFEFVYKQTRIRADFFTRPPRLSDQELILLWKRASREKVPYSEPVSLAKIKMTDRLKDYAVIGELARIMPKPTDHILYSQSPRDLITLQSRYPKLISKLLKIRPLLNIIKDGLEPLEKALDEERRTLMKKNFQRLDAYAKASTQWMGIWPSLKAKIERKPLLSAHKAILEAATEVLPFNV